MQPTRGRSLADRVSSAIVRPAGNIQAAVALIQQEEKEYERVKLALQDQLAGAFRQYLTARNHAEHLQEQILPRVKENLEDPARLVLDL